MYDVDVFYGCGSCGYPLNLRSSNRVMSSVDSKALRKGSLSFDKIDENRVRQRCEFKCSPYIHANGSMGLHQSKTKLLCGNCGAVLGHSHPDSRLSRQESDGSDSCSESVSGIHDHKRYCVKLKALQPTTPL